MGIARDERRTLADLFDHVGPDAPTLCGDWTTRDLAAHLAVRERRPDAAPGILFPPVAGHLETVQRTYADKAWPELVDLVRSGPPWYVPTRIPALDELVNTAEFFIHHEDVRRAQPGWTPRAPDEHRDAALWTVVRRMGPLLLRKSPVGVQARTPQGKTATLNKRANGVAAIGDPGELLLFSFGRDDVAQVTLDGAPASADAVRAAPRGL